MSQLSDQQRAERCAQIMWENDRASADLGMTLLSISPGGAELSLKVKERHLNGHGMCHGGTIFTLADSAFAFACNSYNQNAVAQHNSITYVQSGALGSTLTATATEVSKRGRSGIYDVTVTDDSGNTIAHFRGHSRTIKGQHFDDEV